MMNWLEAFAILFGDTAVGLMFHGFPNIKIGGTHITYNHYNEEEEI
jgi:hypothetical protein